MPALVIVNGDPRPGSRTSQLAATVADGLELDLDGRRTIELADAVAIGFGPEPVAPRDPQPDAVDAVSGAQVLLVSTPSHVGTFPGLLKVFLDRFSAGSLAGVLAVPIVVAGSAAHVESTANDLARVLHELGANTPFTLGVRDDELDTFLASAPEHVRRVSQGLAAALE